MKAKEIIEKYCDGLNEDTKNYFSNFISELRDMHQKMNM